MRKRYSSESSRDQFETIRPVLESARKRTGPRTVDLSEVFCAVVYLLRSGCQWRMLPGGFPKWRPVYAYFQPWSTKPEDGSLSVLEEGLKNQAGAARICIVDAQSLKNTDWARHKGYEAGKKVSGSKRRPIAVDTQGLPTAQVTDRSGALMAFAQHPEGLWDVKAILADANGK